MGRREEACHRPVVTLGMRRVPRRPSGMMHCHVRPKAGSTQYSREEKSKDREGRGSTELGRSRVSEEPLTPTEPQATSNKEIKWQFQRTQQLQECLGYVRLPPCPSFVPWPLSLTPSYSRHSSLCPPPVFLTQSAQRAAAGEAQRIAAFAFTMLN